MSGVVHGIAGLGAMLFGALPPALFAPHAQTPSPPKAPPLRALVSVAALPRARPAIEPPPLVAENSGPSLGALASDLAVPLPRPLPNRQVDPASTDALVEPDERRGFRTGVADIARSNAGSTPLPRARPAAAPRSLADPFAAYGREKPAAAEMLTAFLPPPAVQNISPGDDAACRARLDAMGVTYAPETGVQFVSDTCTVVGPLKVTSVGSRVSLAPGATMNCRTTEALAKWIRDVVTPAAAKHLNSRPTGIAQASAFVCRPRNNVAGARLSEHATGNAVDIASISLEGREPLDIRGRGPAEAGERAFQAEIRQGACRLFTTVLGPGSNAAHATHLHFDLAQRRGGYRLCE